MFTLSLVFILAFARRRTITTETSDFFKSLQDFDLLHFDSDESEHFFHHLEQRYYPVKGTIKFNAFGQDYHIELDKNHALFGDDFKVTNYNGTHVTDVEFDHIDNNCFYHGKVINDDEPSTVAVMACQGHGVKGLIMGHGRTISIKPSLPHVDINSKDTPTVHDEHLVYHIGDVDRKHDRNAPLPTECDLGHELDHVPEHMEILKKSDPNLHEHIVKHHVKGHRHEHEHEDSHEAKEHHHHHHEHSHDDSDSSEDSDEGHNHHHHHEHHDDMVKEINRYHDKIEEILTTKPATDERRNLQLNRAQHRYVELLVVNDPARTISHFGCQETNQASVQCDNLLIDTLAIFSVVTALYRDQPWDYNIQLVITHVQNWFSHDCHGDASYCNGNMRKTEPMSVFGYRTTTAGSSGCVTNSDYAVNPLQQNGLGPSKFQADKARDGVSDYCEASYIDYLSKWHEWRIQSGVAPAHDNAQLLSYYDFYSTVIGYATLRSMCGSYSGGINQMTYDQEYNAGIIAHEMGHNWGMRHDSDGNSCNPANYIMASTGSPNGYRPNEFSTCSIDYLDDFIESKGSQLICLDNVPLPPEYATCGNGFLEQGEQCDCGQDDCSTIDPCCDGTICALKAGNECSLGQPCCDTKVENGVSVCKIVQADENVICRAKSDFNTCDVRAETCDGTSADCPFNEFKVAGEECHVPGAGTEFSPDGQCWDGQCRSQYAYCLSLGFSSCNILEPRVDYCYELKCSRDNQCGIILEDAQAGISGNWPDGTPCVLNGNDSGLCQSGQCKPVDEMKSYMWWAEPFDECTRQCHPSSCSFGNNDDCLSEGCEWEAGVCSFPPKGTQTRVVTCKDMSGNDVDDSYCAGETKLNEQSFCNDIPCGSCDLDCGTGFCQYTAAPNTTFSATTAIKTCQCQNGYDGESCSNPPSITFTGITSVKGADQPLSEAPRCIASGNTENLCPLTVQNGDFLGLTWATTGNPDYFAIGVRKEGDEFAFYPETSTKPIYANKVTAIDDNGYTVLCDNTTDVSFLCQDGSWFWDPEALYAGNYSLWIRYNNEAQVETPIITVECSEFICGANGTCSNGRCVCDEGFSGPYCTSTYCSDWVFINESIVTDAITSASYFTPRCHDHGTCDPTNGDCTCDQGWEGAHCEIESSIKAGCASEAAFLGQSCAHGSVRVFYDDNDPCASRCDCDQINRLSSSSAETQHWTGALCDTCNLQCSNGNVDELCTKCVNCGDEWAGDRCQDLFWVTNFKVDISYDKINSMDKERFQSTLLKDIAYALNDNAFPSSRFDVYAMKPDGDQTEIYFKIIFPTADTSTAQSYGGGVMIRLQDLASDSGSTWYRGMLTGYTDSAYGVAEACIPSFENCDPNVNDRFSEYLMYCFLGSFGFQIVLMVFWHLWTRKQKWKKYQERVQKVAARLQKLQESNEIRGGRQQFKLKPVSRKEARRIYLAGKMKEEDDKKAEELKKKQAEEMKRQEKIEEQKALDAVRKMEEKAKLAARVPGASLVGEGHHGGFQGEGFHQPAAAAAAPGAVVFPRGSQPGVQPGAVPGAPLMPALPKGWIEYKNKSGIPYYYNKKTKTTTWNHPAM